MDEIKQPIKVDIREYKTVEAKDKLFLKVKEKVKILEAEYSFYGTFTDEMIENTITKGFKTTSHYFTLLFFPNFGVCNNT